ncbi:MAG: hypothetical protein A4S09_12135 [Proteobacteria bacterium SG_bin7]|nr:MAG: hypothetical protein A4S09_12135 [Proteobacteria bacterium SG_bin7]
MHKHNLGVIDVGSNAIRLSIGRPTPKGRIKLFINARDPIRLGDEAFGRGELSASTFKKVVAAFKNYRKIFDENEILGYRAVATSAIREAKNGMELIDEIHEKTKVRLEVISGQEEADLIYLALNNALGYPKAPAAYMDIGGGSVEIIISQNDKIQYSKSLKIGTVRLMKMAADNIYDRDFFTNHVRKEIEGAPQTSVKIAGGSGGNVARLGKLRKIILDKKNEHEISIHELEEIIERLFSSTYEERIEKFKMRPDRADVILPASIIVLEFMRYFKIDNFEIPDTGLKEGVLLDLWSHMK